MSASELIVDSAVWIDFFRGLNLPIFNAALELGGIVLTPVVASELVSGAKSHRERAWVSDLLIELPLHETPLDHWIRVGELRRVLREHGVSVSTPDAHVAQCALDRGAWLLSRDKIFPDIAQVLPLQLLTE